jgi:hypothetical protein
MDENGRLICNPSEIDIQAIDTLDAIEFNREIGENVINPCIEVASGLTGNLE